MKLYKIAFCLLCAIGATACSDDDESVRVVNPEGTGTFVDERDGFTYHWVRIGSLDWAVENAHYYTNDETCTIQQDDAHGQTRVYSTRHLARYGYLYNYKGAMEAVPEGWRIPTDEDWQKLEMALGMSAEEANQDGWRGNVGQLMQQDKEGTMLAMYLGGLYASTYRLMACYGFYWSSTLDKSKDGEYVFLRKLLHGSDQVCRESIDKTSTKISLRFVRDAQ